jgi:hypothetical protein
MCLCNYQKVSIMNMHLSKLKGVNRMKSVCECGNLASEVVVDWVFVHGGFLQPLHHASRGNHADVVQLLLDYGASPEVLNALSQTPADLADAGSMTFHRLLESAQHQAADSACDQAS